MVAQTRRELSVAGAPGTAAAARVRNATTESPAVRWLLIVIKLEQFDYAGAAAIGVIMLAASFLILLFINLVQRWSRRHEEN